MDTIRIRLKRFLGLLIYPASLDLCGICGGRAPLHVCAHCDRGCNGIGCRICAAEAARYSTL